MGSKSRRRWRSIWCRRAGPDWLGRLGACGSVRRVKPDFKSCPGNGANRWVGPAATDGNRQLRAERGTSRLFALSASLRQDLRCPLGDGPLPTLLCRSTQAAVATAIVCKAASACPRGRFLRSCNERGPSVVHASSRGCSGRTAYAIAACSSSAAIAHRQMPPCAAMNMATADRQ